MLLWLSILKKRMFFMILIYQVLIFKSLFVKYFDLYIHCITFKVRNEFNLVVFIYCMFLYYCYYYYYDSDDYDYHYHYR